jgi:hypothetical protein
MSKMEKEFIPYEQALALKELGFDEPCFTYFGNISKALFGLKGKIEFHTNTLLDINHSKNVVSSAPTFSQAFRWFREKYNLVCIVFNDDGDIEHDNIRFNWEIRVITHSFKNMKNQKNASVGEYNYKTYEEAELECLKKLIKIVKKK